MPIPDDIRRLREQAGRLFAEVHNANDASSQADPDLRQTVAQMSAALAALNIAVRHAEKAFPNDN